MPEDRYAKVYGEDIAAFGGYPYSIPGAQLSSRIANRRRNDAITAMCGLSGKKVIDVGCGDGTYTLEFLKAGPRDILGIDTVGAAISVAQSKAVGLDSIRFKVASVYDLGRLGENYDVAIIRCVLHHLDDPERAIGNITAVAREIVVVEPNGYSPVLKVIEKVSRYHRDHGERSYFPSQIDRWFTRHGGRVVDSRLYGFVPFFCPDGAARVLSAIEPVVERIPLVRMLACAFCVKHIVVEAPDRKRGKP